MPDQYRRCQKCNVERPLTDFHRSSARPLGRAYVCKACVKEKTQSQPERERRRALQVKRYAKSRLLMQEMKNRPCMDCGGSFPHYVMEWDHPDRSIKSFTIAMRAGGGITPSLMAEIAKCDLICSNCHRVRTRQQFEAGEWKSGRPRFDGTHHSTDPVPSPTVQGASHELR